MELYRGNWHFVSVRTSNMGYWGMTIIAICDLKVGDLVHTHYGVYHLVGECPLCKEGMPPGIELILKMECIK